MYRGREKRMNESALEGFVKIVEMNSFSAAAEALYLSQSALSQQIRTLEGQLQFELFQHVPRRVVLTPAGRDFYPKAKQLVALYQQAVRHARAVQLTETRRSRWSRRSITADPTLALYGCWTGAGDTGLASCWGKSARTR